MLPSSFVIIAIALRLLAGASYVRAVIQGKARPNLVSWFFWGLTALIAFIVQIHEHVGPQALITLAIGIGPIVVFSLAIVKGKHDNHFSAADVWCGVLTAIGIMLWLTTKQPLVALLMSIAADFVSGIPTIIKCYRRPETEHALPYCLSIVSMVITLLATHNWHVANWAFSAYILATNLCFALLIILNKDALLRNYLNRINQRAAIERDI